MSDQKQMAEAYDDFFANSYHQNEGWVLLKLIQICGEHQVPMPPKIYQALSEALDRYRQGKVRTLDEAFGAKRRKNLRLPTLQFQNALVGDMPRKVGVYRRVKELHDPLAVNIPVKLFEKVGLEFQVSGTTAKRYYEAIKAGKYPV